MCCSAVLPCEEHPRRLFFCFLSRFLFTVMIACSYFAGVVYCTALWGVFAEVFFSFFFRFCLFFFFRVLVTATYKVGLSLAYLVLFFRFPDTAAAFVCFSYRIPFLLEPFLFLALVPILRVGSY